MSANVKINWETWLKIQPLTRKWIAGRWSASDQDDVLQAAAEVFVRRHQAGYSERQAMRFAQACCRHAARSMRAWSNNREFTMAPEDSAFAVHSHDPISATERRVLMSQVLDIIEKKCCPELRRATQALCQGEADTLRAAAELAGISEFDLSRRFRTLGRMLVGKVRAVSTKKQKNNGQLELFSV